MLPATKNIQNWISQNDDLIQNMTFKSLFFEFDSAFWEVNEMNLDVCNTYWGHGTLDFKDLDTTA